MRAARLTAVILSTALAFVPLTGVASAAKAPVHLTYAKTATVVRGPVSLRPAGFKLTYLKSKRGSYTFWLCAGSPKMTMPSVGYSDIEYTSPDKTSDVFVRVDSMTSTAATQAMAKKIAATQSHCHYVTATSTAPNVIRYDTFKVAAYKTGVWHGLRVVDHVSWYSKGKHVGRDGIFMSTILWRGNALLEIDGEAWANPQSTVADTLQSRLLHNLAVAGV